ncbi:HMG box-containing protein 1 [Varanus komodoensis]|nr:HMG box-containing protein 1 [Varanus komodoensis]
MAVHKDDSVSRKRSNCNFSKADKQEGYGSDGLKLISHEESVSFGESVLKLTFDPGTVADGLLTVECRLDHPFYVKNKGWSSFYPSLTVVQHGIPCCEMHIGDVCLPPGHPDAINFDDSGVFDTFKSYDFTPMDSSAVYVLSSMARQRRASLSCGGSGSQDFERSECSTNCGPAQSSQNSLHSKAGKSHSSGTASTVSATSPNKCKRPMNAFMLFAKKYRVEYTQMYPGKDNRAISVILGDRWKKMKNEERRMYTLEAKALAEEQKRLNPDCWKRKRTNSDKPEQILFLLYFLLIEHKLPMHLCVKGGESVRINVFLITSSLHSRYVANKQPRNANPFVVKSSAMAYTH